MDIFQSHPMSTTSSTSSITPSDSVSAAANTNHSEDTATNRTSWVWQYFSQVKQGDTFVNKCRANKGHIDKVNTDPEAPVIVCDESMAVDKNGSTKSMSRHLSRAHHIEPPINTSQNTLTGWSATGKMAHVSVFFVLYRFFSSFLSILSRSHLTNIQSAIFPDGSTQQEEPHQCSHPAHCQSRATGLSCRCPRIPRTPLLDQPSYCPHPIKTNRYHRRYCISIPNCSQPSLLPFLVTRLHQHHLRRVDISKNGPDARNYSSLDERRFHNEVCCLVFEGDRWKSHRSELGRPRQALTRSIQHK